ncbi:hypothetical protein INT43_007690 [Umbelopsis isabellina]|uniref:Uncharacterized protein n=1 Tax=Mortierella isabellina TaxID=91625 RepID=A0A8H7U991_MORIS|nr:hypothetical protein INT43_007690 [Umbelopsis isabellina]
MEVLFVNRLSASAPMMSKKVTYWKLLLQALSPYLESSWVSGTKAYIILCWDDPEWSSKVTRIDDELENHVSVLNTYRHLNGC